MRLTYWLIAGFALIVLVVLGTLGYRAYLAPEPPPPTPTAAPSGSVPVNAEGRVVPNQNALLAFAIPGRVEQVLVSAGDQVEAGTVLITLESDSLRAQGDQAQAALAAARAQQELLPSQAKDEAEDLAQAGVDQAEAALEAAILQLDQASLRSPFGGTVISLEVTAGEVVNAGMPVLVLADVSRWKVETLDVLEEDSVRLTLGQPAVVELAAYPDFEIAGSVERLALNATTYRGNVTFTVTIELPEDPGVDLQWGMTAFVEIQPSDSVSAATNPRPTIPSSPQPGATLALASATPLPTATVVILATPTSTATVTPTAQPIIHIVAEGENLFRISLRYGVTVEALRQANGLEGNLIYVGQRLVIPDDSP